MRKAFLIVRLPIETVFGLLYMSGLLLLPPIFREHGASIILFGFIGIPRHTDGSGLSQAELKHLNYEAMFAGLLIVSFLFVNGLLWFKDVHNIIQKLRRRAS